LISDGWTSVYKEKVINYVVVSPLMRPLLWCTTICGEDEQTAEYVASEISEVIDEINKAAGEDVVVSVTTDNAPMMQKAWEILEATRPIFCNGCSSHALNLILEELLARFRRLQKEGDEEHRRALRMPVPTRWYSSFEFIKTIVADKGFWKRIKLVQTLLEPIVEAVAMLEHDICCISMVY
ncbi:hypothetical protein PHYSODRAFT_479933, partial [Phytophthora sojae]